MDLLIFLPAFALIFSSSLLLLRTSESLYEDEAFEERELAALVASKLYCHLGEFNDSINFLLGAGSLFDINSKDEYVEFMLSNVESDDI